MLIQHDHGDAYVANGYLVVRFYGQREVKNGWRKSHLEPWWGPSMVIPIDKVDGDLRPLLVNITSQYAMRKWSEKFVRSRDQTAILVLTRPGDHRLIHTLRVRGGQDIWAFLRELSGYFVEPGAERQAVADPVTSCTYCGYGLTESSNCGQCGAPAPAVAR